MEQILLPPIPAAVHMHVGASLTTFASYAAGNRCPVQLAAPVATPVCMTAPDFELHFPSAADEDGAPVLWASVTKPLLAHHLNRDLCSSSTPVCTGNGASCVFRHLAAGS